MKRLFLFLLFLLLPSASIFASDLAREHRMQAEIEDAILDGEVISLNANETPFMGIYTEVETEPAKGAIVILHGMGAHPDWPDIISPLRVALPEDGWNTLSIQLPIGASDATYEDYLPLLGEASPRIAAAAAFLQAEGAPRIILLSHSLGGRMASLYLANNPESAVDGFIAIGLSADDSDKNAETIKQLMTLKIPFLDIYGSDDLQAVLDTADARKRAAKGPTEQIIVDGANHFFLGKDEELITVVSTWLKTNFNTN